MFLLLRLYHQGNMCEGKLDSCSEIALDAKSNLRIPEACELSIVSYSQRFSYILTVSQDWETIRQSGRLLWNGWNNSKPTVPCVWDRLQEKWQQHTGAKTVRELSSVLTTHSSVHIHFAISVTYDPLLVKFRGLMVNRRKMDKNIEFCLLVAHSLVREMTWSMCAFGES